MAGAKRSRAVLTLNCHPGFVFQGLTDSETALTEMRNLLLPGLAKQEINPFSITNLFLHFFKDAERWRVHRCKLPGNIMTFCEEVPPSSAASQPSHLFSVTATLSLAHHMAFDSSLF